MLTPAVTNKLHDTESVSNMKVMNHARAADYVPINVTILTYGTDYGPNTEITNQTYGRKA